MEGVGLATVLDSRAGVRHHRSAARKGTPRASLTGVAGFAQVVVLAVAPRRCLRPPHRRPLAQRMLFPVSPPCNSDLALSATLPPPSS